MELFAGIGGFRLACDRLGMKTVWANDHAALASRVYRDRFGEAAFVEGDIAELRERIPRHDVLTAGFPCQPFSSAGKKRGVRDPRGTLFQHIVEIVAEHRPRWFVLENVKRLLTMEYGSHFATILAALSELEYRLEWRLLNAKHFGLAQNRERVFIVGSRDVKAKPTLAATEELPKGWNDSDAWAAISDHKKRFPTWGIAEQRRFVGCNPTAFSQAQAPVMLDSILESDPPAACDFTETTLARLKDNRPVNRFVHGVEILSNQGGGARMGYTIFGTSGLAPTLTSTASRHYERYRVGDCYRRLTHREYARLQGFPDEHCDAVSTYDRYAIFGAAVPPPMVEWVLRRLVSSPLSPLGRGVGVEG
ncbi:MAG: DNA (cytosine-5-)-methyltransferase [Gemmataceae bacterium]